MINRAVIGIGSNISPQENIAKALEILKSKFLIVNQSEFVKTKPIGRPEQNDFLNGAILVETHLDAYELRALLKQMEAEIGRQKDKDPFAARVIDLDLVVYNGRILDEDFYARNFLKKATLEVLPDLRY
jgi:2-amino-4-hydroxy-6-hydroxymethyldihydropteridine diphosphokinase